MQKVISIENLSFEGEFVEKADLKMSEMLLNLKEEVSNCEYQELFDFEIEIQYQEKLFLNDKLEKESKIGKKYIMNSTELKRDCIQLVFIKLKNYILIYFRPFKQISRPRQKNLKFL